MAFLRAVLLIALLCAPSALASSPATTRTPELARYESFRYGAFVHYNINTYGPEDGALNDYFGGDCQNADLFAPTRLDVKGWVKAFKDAGMGYAVLTTRHIGGFLLWDSKTSRYSAPNSRFSKGRDIVAEFVSECRKQGLGVGLYFLVGGGPADQSSCPIDGHPYDTATLKAQLRELATSYGPIDLFWLDMMDWRAPDELTTQELYDLVKGLQPHAVVHFNQHIEDGCHIHYFPTDVVNGEETPPSAPGYDPNANNLSRDARTDHDRATDDNLSYHPGTYYLPYEYSLTAQVTPDETATTPVGSFHNTLWFARRSTRSEDARLIYAQASEAYRRGAANVLLASAPDESGSMRKADTEQIKILGSLIRSGARLALEPESLARKVVALGEKTTAPAAVCRFRVGHQPLAVTALSRFRVLGASSAPATLELRDPATGRVLAQALSDPRKSHPDWNGFDQAELSEAVPLEAGHVYELRAQLADREPSLVFHATPRVETDGLIETLDDCQGPLSLVAHPQDRFIRAYRGIWDLRAHTAGCAPDLTPHANPACAHAGARYTDAGLALDGKAAHAVIAHSGSLTTGGGGLAIEATVLPKKVDGLRDIVSHGYTATPAREVFLRINGGHYEFGTWSDGRAVAASGGDASRDLGRWVSLRGVFDGTRWLLFRNGEKIAETSSAVAPAEVPADWGVGGCARGLCPNGETRGFAGTISHVSIAAQTR